MLITSTGWWLVAIDTQASAKSSWIASFSILARHPSRVPCANLGGVTCGSNTNCASSSPTSCAGRIGSGASLAALLVDVAAVRVRTADCMWSRNWFRTSRGTWPTHCLHGFPSLRHRPTICSKNRCCHLRALFPRSPNPSLGQSRTQERSCNRTFSEMSSEVGTNSMWHAFLSRILTPER